MTPEAFIRAQTRVAAPPLVPEIRLHLATEVTPLWHATEALLERTGLPPPYWAFAWPGGQALARHILDRPALVEGRRVVDFAAGSGLAAIAAAKAGAAGVLANDIDAFAVAAARLNAALNDVAIEATADDLVDRPLTGVEVVLCGDICYERPMAERALRWLRRLAGDGALVVLADPGRAFVPTTGLERLASHAVPTSLDLEDRTTRDTVIWRLLPG